MKYLIKIHQLIIKILIIIKNKINNLLNSNNCNNPLKINKNKLKDFFLRILI